MSEPVAKSPLKHQLLVLALIVGGGGVAYLAMQPNPYATPETTFKTAMDAVAQRNAEAAWDCVDAIDRRKIAFMAKRLANVGADEDPLEALFDEGIERYPDLQEAVLERVQLHHNDPNRAQAWISWGRWQVQVDVYRQGEEWRFDKVSDAILGGVKPRRQ